MIAIGEAFEGEGANAAHINLILGTKAELGAAYALAAASPGPGHIPFQAVVKPNLPAKPATLFIAKSVLKDARHEAMTWGPAQAGVAAGITEALLGGVLPAEAGDDWVAIALVWVDPAADDAEAVYGNNREATRSALVIARAALPAARDAVAKRAEPWNPFFTPRPPGPPGGAAP